MKQRVMRKCFVLCSSVLLAACSINNMAIKRISDMMSQGESAAVFMEDNDPELAGAALPFAIKMYETLLSKNPDHQGLLLSTGSLFVMYANGFVQGPAEALDTEYYAEREAAMQRAKQLYLRGAALLYSALEKKYPGLGRAEEQGELASYLAKMGADDVPLLYWTAAGMLSAYSLDVFDFDLGAKIPELSGFIARAYELDPDFNRGAIDEFYILYYAALPEIMGGDKARAEQHFNRALEKSERLSASPYLYYAQGICVPAQDYEGFKEKLNAALAIDVDAAPSLRLMNILAQRKARRLLDRAYYYFSFLSEDDYDNW